MKFKLSQLVLRSKCYANSKKEYNSMKKSVKKIIHEKECDIGTDHQCKVWNVQQCRQVPEQEKVRECNLVNNLVCNGIHGDEVMRWWSDLICNYRFELLRTFSKCKWCFIDWWNNLFFKKSEFTRFNKINFSETLPLTFSIREKCWKNIWNFSVQLYWDISKFRSIQHNAKLKIAQQFFS